MVVKRGKYTTIYAQEEIEGVWQRKKLLSIYKVQ